MPTSQTLKTPPADTPAIAQKRKVAVFIPVPSHEGQYVEDIFVNGKESNGEGNIAKENTVDGNADDLNNSGQNTANSMASDLATALSNATKSHKFLKGTTPSELLAELEKSDADLILVASPDWQPSAKGVEDLIFGYEMGARIAVGRRPKESQPPTLAMVIRRLALYILFGAKRQDPDTPLRLYDKEAFLHVVGVLAHFQNTFPQDFYLISAIEYYFGFNAVGVLTSGWKYQPESGHIDILKMITSLNNVKAAIRIYRSQHFG